MVRKMKYCIEVNINMNVICIATWLKSDNVSYILETNVFVGNK